MFGRGIITTMTFCIELVKLESISHKIVSEKKKNGKGKPLKNMKRKPEEKFPKTFFFSELEN